MKKIFTSILITGLLVVSAPSAFAYIYHCPSVLPDPDHTGDAEMWPNSAKAAIKAMGGFHFVGAQYDFTTGESSCSYVCPGCGPTGCECKEPEHGLIKGSYVKPIVDDSTKWKPSLDGKSASCLTQSNDQCPWRLKSDN